MSRIHDALKKAEQERALGKESTPVEVSVRPSPGVTPEAPAVAPPAVLSMEALLRHCPQPTWKPDPHSILAADGNHRTGLEEFRTLRARLYKIREKHPLKTVLISSALPAEGKTFVAANLAQVIVRQHERRALLIDGDLRCSRLHEALGTQSSPGLSDYLSGQADEYTVVQRSAQGNLFFIPGGKPAPHPNELLANGRMRQLLHKLGPLFDWIVIDSPPVLPVSDALLLADMADGILMVVRAKETPYPLAQKARGEFQDKPLIGVVLNHAMPAQSYYSYYSYGYSLTGRNGKAKD